MIAFIEERREACEVEPVRGQLPIASSTCCARAAIARDPGLASDRAKRDAEDLESIRCAHDGSGGRYGARKVWHQLRRSRAAPWSGSCAGKGCKGWRAAGRKQRSQVRRCPARATR